MGHGRRSRGSSGAGGNVRLFDGSELPYGKTGWRNPEFIAHDANDRPATPDNIAEAGKRLKNGGRVSSETVYGKGADATSDTAVARIFAAKNRPDFNPAYRPCAGFEHRSDAGRSSRLRAKNRRKVLAGADVARSSQEIRLSRVAPGGGRAGDDCRTRPG